MSIHRCDKGVRNHLCEASAGPVAGKWFLIPLSQPFALLALLLLIPSTADAEISVRLSSETASPILYEPFTLRLDVSSDVAPETPELPTVPDVAVTAIHRLPADPAQRKHSFQIELISERDGIVTIPPFAVWANGESMLTSALRLHISRPRLANEMTLEVAIEPTSLRVGQPATVTVIWRSEVPFTRCKQLLFEIPLLTDERCDIYPLHPAASESKEVGLPVNNVRIVAQADRLADGGRSMVFRYKLVPREPCVLRAPPARLLCALLKEDLSAGESPSYFYNHFFEATGSGEVFEEIYLAAPLPEITVRDLAEAGRKPSFADIVGPCELRTSVAPTRMTVGQPALFTVRLDNLTFARQIAGLPSAAFDGLRSDFQLSQEPIREQATDNARSFTHTLRPLRAGITRIPAIVIQTFDPDTGKYRTLRSEPIQLTVEARQDNGSRTFARRVDAKPPIQLHGVRHNRRDEWAMISTQNLLEFFGRQWWLFVPLPPMIWLTLLPLARHWDRCRRDPVYARARAAWRRFRRTAGRDEELAWRSYLADRLDLCAEALTADTVTESLHARNVDARLIAEARQRFEARDAADYGKRPTSPSQATHALVRRLHKATHPLLLICGLLIPLQAVAADGADDLFARAIQMRGDKPDEAQPLFVEAALHFELADRFVNAGNSWYLAGENGRALANYRIAESRAPFDRQIRESIEFLRANRLDDFPPPVAPTGQLAAWWSGYCTWAPVLRVGSFVLAYLFLWIIFLTTRLSGRRVNRAVWIVLLAVTLTPLASLVHSSLQHAEGVVIEDAIARLGPGYAYDSAFKKPLHKATEFTWMETRQGWVRVRLPDASEGWLRESGCMRLK